MTMIRAQTGAKLMTEAQCEAAGLNQYGELDELPKQQKYCYAEREEEARGKEDEASLKATEGVSASQSRMPSTNTGGNLVNGH